MKTHKLIGKLGLFHGNHSEDPWRYMARHSCGPRLRRLSESRDWGTALAYRKCTAYADIITLKRGRVYCLYLNASPGFMHNYAEEGELHSALGMADIPGEITVEQVVKGWEKHRKGWEIKKLPEYQDNRDRTFGASVSSPRHIMSVLLDAPLANLDGSSDDREEDVAEIETASGRSFYVRKAGPALPVAGVSIYRHSNGKFTVYSEYKHPGEMQYGNRPDVEPILAHRVPFSSAAAFLSAFLDHRHKGALFVSGPVINEGSYHLANDVIYVCALRTRDVRLISTTTEEDMRALKAQVSAAILSGEAAESFRTLCAEQRFRFALQYITRYAGGLS